MTAPCIVVSPDRGDNRATVVVFGPIEYLVSIVTVSTMLVMASKTHINTNITRMKSRG